MRGDLLALGSAAVLAGLGATLSRRDTAGSTGSRSVGETRWFHGSPSCGAVLKSGIVRPSAQVEKTPTLASALKLYDETVSGLDEDDQYDARHAWRDVVLTPMRGFAYATHDPVAARKYADSKQYEKVRGCVVEVAIEPGTQVVPDEDWLGFVVSMEMFGYNESRVPATRSALDADAGNWGSPDWNGSGFTAWRDQIKGLLSKPFVRRLRGGVDEAVDLLGGLRHPDSRARRARCHPAAPPGRGGMRVAPVRR